MDCLRIPSSSMDTGLSLQVPGEAEGTGEKIDINVER